MNASRPNANNNIPIWIAVIPLIALTTTLVMVIKCFGSDSVAGGSQVALFFASSVCATLAICVCGCSWRSLEDAIVDNIHTSASAIIILLLIGAISGSWMIGGIVPTFIYYGLKVLHPAIFLGAACVICALVSILTGSSWTTIATIGVALMGIGRAEGFSDGWIAGAIISGAYFGDKMSALSDTTVLASSSCRVPLFEHIRYMSITTMPSFVVSIAVFFVASFLHTSDNAEQMRSIVDALDSTFVITPWLFVVPIITGYLIFKRLPAIITLFVAVVAACIAIVVFQKDMVDVLGGDGMLAPFRAVMITCYGSTSVATGNQALDMLVATSGMSGMLNTIWLIICAMCFGGVMKGSGMLDSITSLFLRHVHSPVGAVTSTATSGVFCNMCMADQYISIIITGNMFADLYRSCNLEQRLLSRSVEDSATVTSVLIPWNSCGITQSTVLGVTTITYLPYCIFNIISPLMSIAVAAIGYKIKRYE